ncbi:MAG: alpha/beta hydrolase [Lysobacteraceae bacterium]|nr:MAG: alpha/beta hydrolase [Xanthomonadaceae bacterium]
MCLLACSLALSAGALAAAAQEGTPARTNSIQQFLFSAESSAGVEAEFDKMGVVLTDVLAAPAEGHTTWVTGTGPSGFPAPYRIDSAKGRFHVYADRRRPQHPIAPLPYESQEVMFDTPNPAVSPVGTLTYPGSGTNFPAVVLVAGTGPHTRDAGMSLHKTLLVLADHLTRQGFAVLRYDKRGIGLTGGALHPGSTTDDYAADALAAVRFLKLQPNINAARIGLVGHSEGGIIAAMVAAEAPEDVAFIVMLAGTGLPGLENQSLQGAAFARADGVPEPLIRLNQKLERVQLEIAASKLGRQEALDATRMATEALSAEDKITLEIPPEGLPAEAFENLVSPWFRRFLALDPRTYLEKVRCPVLALVGDKDLQVPPAENLQGIERALERGGNPHATVRQLPSINHNLQTARTGKLSEYFLIEETVAPSVLALMSTWMKDVAANSR